jgi:hypothetical protein
MAQRLSKLVLAVLLIAALGTKCALACMTPDQGKVAGSHGCCHKSKTEPQHAQNDECQGQAFETEKIASSSEPPVAIVGPSIATPLAADHLIGLTASASDRTTHPPPRAPQILRI